MTTEKVRSTLAFWLDSEVGESLGALAMDLVDIPEEGITLVRMLEILRYWVVEESIEDLYKTNMQRTMRAVGELMVLLVDADIIQHSGDPISIVDEDEPF